MSDPFRFQLNYMVEHQLEKRGIRDPRVLEAFRKVPRHEFVPDKLKSQAYADGPLPVGDGQTISQPYMVAIMTQSVAVHPGHRVLEVGTGSGYQAGILAELGAKVFTIERIPELAEKALARLWRLGYNGVDVRIGDGTQGWQEKAPYAAIIVTAGSPQIPAPLLGQLAMGGRLVIPIGQSRSQVLYTALQTRQGLTRSPGERCKFVPLIGEHGWGTDPGQAL